MAVGFLPPMADGSGPGALFLIRGCAQTGRADTGGHSALGIKFWRASKKCPHHKEGQSQPGRQRNMCCRFHKLLRIVLACCYPFFPGEKKWLCDKPLESWGDLLRMTNFSAGESIGGRCKQKGNHVLGKHCARLPEGKRVISNGNLGSA